LTIIPLLVITYVLVKLLTLKVCYGYIILATSFVIIWELFCGKGRVAVGTEVPATGSNIELFIYRMLRTCFSKWWESQASFWTNEVWS
jgi:hypothetical protein